jgi:hypothetical protein
VIGEIILDMLGHGTARVLVPALTFGAVSVEPISGEPLRHNWFGIGRRADGSLQLEATMASWLGVLVWCFILIFALAWLR